MSTSRADVGDQRRIWDHFQTANLDSFADSEARLRGVVSLLPPRSTVLNIGVGGGILEARARSQGHVVISIDPGEATVRDVKRRLAGLPAGVGLIETLGFRNNVFDAVVASEVLEHLDEHTLEQGLAEVRRVMRPGGTFVATVPREEDLSVGEVACPCCGAVFHRWGHQQSFDEDRLRAVVGAHLIVESVVAKRFVPWRRRSWKGRTAEVARLVLLRLGFHGANENLVLVARRAA